jgi:hypothetical protein
LSMARRPSGCENLCGIVRDSVLYCESK